MPRNWEVIAKFKGKSCDACGKSRSSDPCHIRSRGAGGPDEEWNLLSMCRGCHTKQHQYGWHRFARNNVSLMWKLEQKGWMFDGRNRLVNNKTYADKEEVKVCKDIDDTLELPFE